jgi:hypothetical protein
MYSIQIMEEKSIIEHTQAYTLKHTMSIFKFTYETVNLFCWVHPVNQCWLVFSLVLRSVLD